MLWIGFTMNDLMTGDREINGSLVSSNISSYTTRNGILVYLLYTTYVLCGDE